MERLRVGCWHEAGVAGAITFWLFQVLTIPQFMVSKSSPRVVTPNG